MTLLRAMPGGMHARIDRREPAWGERIGLTGAAWAP
jgi:hypothetical protein